MWCNLTDLEDERAWKVRFSATTDEQWDKLAEMVRQDIVAGDTFELGEVFPVREPEP